jgi:hypothetical protein
MRVFGMTWGKSACTKISMDRPNPFFSKSNSLAGENQGLKSNNWELISVARRAQGDLEGAEAAEAQAVVSQGGEEDQQAASENNE